MATNDATLRIGADTSAAEKAVKKLEKDSKESFSAMAAAASAAGNVAAAGITKGFELAAEAGKKLVEVTIELVKATNSQELVRAQGAWEDLKQAFIDSARESTALAGTLDALASAFQGVTAWVTSPEGLEAINTYFQAIAKGAALAAKAMANLEAARKAPLLRENFLPLSFEEYKRGQENWTPKADDFWVQLAATLEAAATPNWVGQPNSSLLRTPFYLLPPPAGGGAAQGAARPPVTDEQLDNSVLKLDRNTAAQRDRQQRFADQAEDLLRQWGDALLEFRTNLAESKIGWRTSQAGGSAPEPKTRMQLQSDYLANKQMKTADRRRQVEIQQHRNRLDDAAQVPIADTLADYGVDSGEEYWGSAMGTMLTGMESRELAAESHTKKMQGIFEKGGEAIGVVVGSMTNDIAAMAAGADIPFSQFLGNMISALGQYVLQTGSAAITTGAIRALMGDPVGLPLMALGAGAVAVGAGMIGIGSLLGGDQAGPTTSSTPSAPRSPPRVAPPEPPDALMLPGRTGSRVINVTFTGPVGGSPRRVARDLQMALEGTG